VAKIRPYVFLLSTLLFSLVISPSLSLTGTLISSYGTVDYPVPGFLEVENGTLYKDGRPFVIRANNYDNALGTYLAYQVNIVDQAITECKTYGFGGVRTWATGTGGEQEAVYSLWRSDPVELFRRFDEFIQICKSNNVGLVITLGVVAFFQRGGGNLGDPNSGAYALYKEWVTQVCSRYRNEPTILFWEILNEYEYSGEPFGLVRAFNENAARDIKAADPNHLVSSGSGNWGYNTDNWNLCNGAIGVDIASVHIYSDEVENMLYWRSGWPSYELVKEFILQWKERAEALGKVMFFGELGGDVGYDYATNTTANPDNQIFIWCLQAIYEIRENYGFHGFRSGACTDKYAIVPEHNPQTIDAFKQYNGI
jgi:hypothetical protein